MADTGWYGQFWQACMTNSGRHGLFWLV